MYGRGYDSDDYAEYDRRNKMNEREIMKSIQRSREKKAMRRRVREIERERYLNNYSRVLEKRKFRKEHNIKSATPTWIRFKKGMVNIGIGSKKFWNV